MWIYLGLLSALFLGMYDVSRKQALRDNAVLPVLFLSTVFSASVAAALVILSKLYPSQMIQTGLYVPAVCFTGHMHLLAKSAIISASWVLSFSALKHLPLSIISPIGASGPVWTLIAAILLFHEQPNTMQYLGFGLMVLSYYFFSVIGSREGIVFYNNKWVIFTFLSLLLGTLSALYDKFLIQTLGYSAVTVQMWFIIYLVPLLGLVSLLCWYPARWRHTPFEWRWSILCIGFFLIIADFIYFNALTDRESLIGILSALRASCVVVSFTAAGLLFREVRISSKAFALAGVLGGVCLILLSKIAPFVSLMSLHR
jgi:transporter family protein